MPSLSIRNFNSNSKHELKQCAINPNELTRTKIPILRTLFEGRRESKYILKYNLT